MSGSSHVLPRSERPGYRPELQGLRAVAIGLVVVYHIWFGRVSGGLDVFFLLSGFFVTLTLLSGLKRDGRVDLGRYFGRLVMRLWPMALLVLVAIMVATWLLMPESRWDEIQQQVVAASLYYENWHLAAISTDYLADHWGASPVQHYWSLSVQGQGFLVWPLLVFFAAAMVGGFKAAAGERNQRFRRLLLATFVVLGLGLFAFSVWFTGVDQPSAYFNSFARGWEFLLGGVLALLIGLKPAPLPVWLRVLMGWVGLVAICICGFVITGATSFPGFAALWPTLAAVLVVAAGGTGWRFGADRLLASRPAEHLGNIAYSLYLWHWPLLIFYLHETGQSTPGLLPGLGLIAAALLLAELSTWLVERPMMGWRPGFPKRWPVFATGAAMLVPLLVVTFAWHERIDSSVLRAQEAVAVARTNPDRFPGAAAIDNPDPGFVAATSIDEVSPQPLAASRDLARMYDDGCMLGVDEMRDQLYCRYGNPDASRKVVLIGSSTAIQWLPALERLASRHDWQLVTFGKSGCPLSVDVRNLEYRGRPNPTCEEWNRLAVDEAIAMDPDLVVVTGSRVNREGVERADGLVDEEGEALVPGVLEQWKRFDDAGIDLAAIRSNPLPDYDPAECLEDHGPSPEVCSIGLDVALARAHPAASTGLEHVFPVDLTEFFCIDGRCPSVIGNVTVQRDQQHVTATYSATLAPMLGRQLETFKPELFSPDGEREVRPGGSG